ncbi:MAG: TlpA family protein disulfide reductase [Deltaproteobacteria bacterium]|nr:TlpA family protein disulfide reductase [Deltaproteobacteria bacterium]
MTKKIWMLTGVALLAVIILPVSGCKKAEEAGPKPAPAVTSTQPAPVPSPLPPTTTAPATKDQRGEPVPEKKTAGKKTTTPISLEKEVVRNEATGVSRELSREKTTVAKATPAEKTPVKPKLLLAAPSFTLNNYDGNPVSLGNQRGKVVLIMYTATWCPPCKKILPELKELYQRYRGKGFVLLSIFSEEVSQIESYVKKNNLPFSGLVDDGKIVQRKYGIAVLPTFVVIDRKGRIARQAQYGALANILEEMEKEIVALL